MAVKFLEKRGYAKVVAESSGKRGKSLKLSAKGRRAREQYWNLLKKIEDRWNQRFGKEKIAAVRRSLERLAGDGTSPSSPLFAGLVPGLVNWLSSGPPP